MNKKSKQVDREGIGGSDSTFSSSPSNNQQSVLPTIGSENGGYDDPSIPYVPRPAEPGQSWKMATTPSYSRRATAPLARVKTEGVIVLIGLVLGAALGALLAYLLKGDMVTWALAGAGIGAVLALVLYSSPDEAASGVLGEAAFMAIPELFNCCSVSLVLMLLGSAGLIGGILIMHGWLLA